MNSSLVIKLLTFTSYTITMYNPYDNNITQQHNTTTIC